MLAPQDILTCNCLCCGSVDMLRFRKAALAYFMGTAVGSKSTLMVMNILHRHIDIVIDYRKR